MVVFHLRDKVMAKDVTRTSKWHSFYEGPSEIDRLNKGGAYILKDAAYSLLPFRFPPCHLKLVSKLESLMEKSYLIKRRTRRLVTNWKYDYYVQFDIPDTTPVWIAAEMFDSPIRIEKYWKGINKQNLKTNMINSSTTRDKTILPTLGEEEDDDDITIHADRGAAILTQDERVGAVQTDEHLTQADRGSAVQTDAKLPQDD
jgi:hypothetical protein